MRYVILRNGQEVPVEITERPNGYQVILDGTEYEVDCLRVVKNLYSVIIGGISYEATVHHPGPDQYNVHLYDGMRTVELVHPSTLALRKNKGHGGGAGGSLKAPMPGKVVKVLVSPGDEVESGAGLVILEAMKMQNELQASQAGRVKEVRAAEGDNVERGAVLVVMETE